ncbi:peroxisomal targeting signal 2 receptor [[Candida] jaroonii]|uniref:Peroxisomal targeting signal 2 receptor n=1 Tax=[Candida] jaroonii TaxID=467808 RepID=A0ACA9Y7L9_9ASCO|nr:peroxisomal targeting signal 2 receptor [[Candida] jaroonii]
MLSFRTKNYNGYAVQYSPFFDSKLAVASAANYGLVGNGKLFILNIQPNGEIINEVSWETQDGLFDLAWSEIHENQVVTANGDGSIKLFDIKVPNFPIMNYKEHQKEVFSVNWNLVDKSSFVSSSWDGTIKVWNPQRQQSIVTLASDGSNGTGGQSSVPISHQPNHQVNTTNCVYNATFSPHSPSLILSCNGSSKISLWDIRSPQPLIVNYIGHSGLETLTCDWNKYKSDIIASGGTDKSVRIWDLRMINRVDQQIPGMPSHNLRGPTPLNELLGHEFAIRKVQWSPHNSEELISVSYDMTCRIWNDKSNSNARFLNTQTGGLRGVMNNHREFVIGCDYSLWGDPGWVATTGWDEMVYVWDSKRLMR